MHNARDVIRQKGGGVFAVTPESSVLEAMRLMAEKNIGAVMVMTGDRITGIVSERAAAPRRTRRSKTS